MADGNTTDVTVVGDYGEKTLKYAQTPGLPKPTTAPAAPAMGSAGIQGKDPHVLLKAGGPEVEPFKKEIPADRPEVIQGERHHAPSIEQAGNP